MNEPYFNRQQPEVPEQGEYNEIDTSGRRFRRIGKNCIEFEPEINGLPQSVFYASQKSLAEQREQQRKEETAAREAEYTGRDCPFKIAKNNLESSCKKSCAFYADTGCALSRPDTPATKDTKNMDCIIARKCNPRCAMYNHGCTLIDIFKGIKPGKE